ncbi:MAG: mechanosensitive ion channel family protein [Candidatus Dormibacteria bacterium]
MFRLPILILVLTVAAALALHMISLLILRRVAEDHHPALQSLLKRSSRPLQVLLPLVGIEIALNVVKLPVPLRDALLHGFGIALILGAAWLLVRLSYVLDDMILGQYQLDVGDNLRARRVHTQIQVLRGITTVAVAVVALSMVLLTFPEVRAAGIGLLASAGLIGLVAGVAAKPVATNLVAGIQIAFSQPIRVDDVVVVEGHWGRVEQITLTFVVIRVWDLRRLVLPISYFIETPFENWTRSTADILGWVHMEVDYSAPVGELRQQLQEVVAKSPSWNGKVCVLQVTQLGSETMQLRALFSAADSSLSWNLQCEVREGMIDFLQRHHPGCLPHRRADVQLSSSPAGELGSDGLDPDESQAAPRNTDESGGAPVRTARHQATHKGDSPPAGSSSPGP